MIENMHSTSSVVLERGFLPVWAYSRLFHSTLSIPVVRAYTISLVNPRASCVEKLPLRTGPMKTDLNADIFESVFIVESDRASFKLQNDTKIDLLATFFPEICSRERYKGIATPS